MDVPIGIILTIGGALAAAVGVLYRQNLAQQKDFEALLTETKELMGALSELIRNSNGLMEDVKNCMRECITVRNSHMNDGGPVNDNG